MTQPSVPSAQHPPQDEVEVTASQVNDLSGEPEQESPFSFSAISHGFREKINGLRVFAERIGEAAATHDRSAWETFSKVLDNLLPDDQDPTGDDEDAPFNGETDTEQGSVLLRDPIKTRELVAASIAFQRSAPVQRSILLDSTLVSLMSHVEAIIADLVHVYYRRFPGAMPADERTLSLNDLRSLGSIEEAEEYLIAKEVDSLLRESLETQLDYFRKRLKVDLNPLTPILDAISETNLRRNLLVHNRGVVNRTYLSRLPAAKNGMGPTLGKRLASDEVYIAQALDVAELLGVILISQCWRKWERAEAEAEASESFVVNALFETLQDERYQLVESLAEFAYTLGMTESGKRVVCINHAIALRDSDRSDEVPNVVAKYDWTTASLRFRLAVHAVLGEEDELYRLLPRAVAAEEIAEEELRAWPLFRPYREMERFVLEIAKAFPDPASSSS